MITYAHAVIWVWTVALVATLVLLGMAWRAIVRADAAVGALRSAVAGVRSSDPERLALAEEVAATRGVRTGLIERSDALSEP